MSAGTANGMGAVHCPVCEPGPELRALDPHLLRVPLLRCDRCLGVLADPSTVAVAATYYHATHYVMSEGHGRHHCRSCGELFDLWRERCRTCGKPQTLCCVRCLGQMEVLEIGGVAIDVCRPCRMVWFDRGELGLLTRRHAASLQSGLTQRPRSGFASALLDSGALAHADLLPVGIDVARHAGGFAIDAASHLSGSAVVELAASAGEGAVELTSGAIEVLLGIVSDIF